MKPDIAGDPISGLKWTKKTTDKIAVALQKLGVEISGNTVGRLLKEMDFRLRVNHKKRSAASPKDRDQQFKRIKRMRQLSTKRGDPVISIDSKKKEQVGNFKNSGATWRKEPYNTHDHDFRSLAEGVAIPYAMYDPNRNRGFVVVGTSRETPEFAVDCLVKWWQSEGAQHYSNAKRLLILADGGGGNAASSRVWKSRCKANFATDSASLFLCAIIHREHQNGTKSSNFSIGQSITQTLENEGQEFHGS